MGEENGLRAEMNAGTDYSDFSWRPIPWFQSCAAGSTTCFGCHIKTHDDSIPKSQQFIVMTPSGVQKERVVDEDMYVLSTNGSVLFEPLAKSWPHKPPRCFVLEGMLYTKKMDTKYKLIPEISVTEKDKNWTAKVIVSEKTSARTSQNGSIRYQNLILMDPQKNKIQATLFDNHITAFEDLLLLSKTYLISNATIKLTKPEYVASVGPIHWVITGKTRVIEIQEDNNALLSSTYNFTPFDKLKEYMDVNADISIIGVAIDIKPKRLIKVRSGGQSYVQDVVLVDQSFDTILLTLWDCFVDKECVYISQHLSKKPIVIAKHLKVSSFHGLSLSTKGNSSFFIDAPFTQVTELKSWVDENIENLNQLIVEKSYFIASPAKVPIPNDKMITYIKNISGLHHMQTYFWVKAKANLQRQEQAYWYMSCSNCNKLSGADVNEVFECVFCKCKQAYGAPRARATIQLQDATSSLLATVIGPPAETFFKCSAYDLMKGTTKNENSDIVETMRTSIEEDVLFYVKAVPKDKQEGYKYDVIFIINPSEIPGKTVYIESEEKTTTPHSASSDLVPYALVTPTSKRVLFREHSASSSSKKKQSGKHDNIGQSTSDEATVEESY
ncbi:Replication protein A 70 kDa DNA-binding subunit B [Abeliophyllum distichum]|uniref:Replication protein A 70 kDa DNA-binding subunit B n=1 Tax=Abeliophyllum distichum TaxID=126358 RepID=A0ABD1TYZ9_9LAMI